MALVSCESENFEFLAFLDPFGSREDAQEFKKSFEDMNKLGKLIVILFCYSFPRLWN
jgi:hypothetical protein